MAESLACQSAHLDMFAIEHAAPAARTATASRVFKIPSRCREHIFLRGLKDMGWCKRMRVQMAVLQLLCPLL